MARQRGPETFAPYQLYLNQKNVWPRVEGPDDDSWQFIRIEEMVPNHAASALAKLCRWARHWTLAATLNIHDADARDTFVRQSTLGRALAQRAQGLPAVEDPPGDDPKMPSKHQLALLIAKILSDNDHTRGWSLTHIVETAEVVADGLIDEAKALIALGRGG